MGRNRFFHPRMMLHLSRFYPAQCAIQEATFATNGYGERLATWHVKAGHEAIRCRVEALGGYVVQPGELEVNRFRFTLALRGHYPEIVPPMRVLLEDTAYLIVQVDHDPEGISTWLVVEVIA